MRWRKSSACNGGPFRAWGCALGWCVLDCVGFNCWVNNEEPGVVFGVQEAALKMVELWNQ